MNLRPTLTMPRERILIQKNLCSIMQTTWMPNHVIVQFLQTGVVSQQITQKATTIILEIVVSIKVAPCLSDQMIQQNAMITSPSEDGVNVKARHRWEIQGDWRNHCNAIFSLWNVVSVPSLFWTLHVSRKNRFPNQTICLSK